MFGATRNAPGSDSLLEPRGTLQTLSPWRNLKLKSIEMTAKMATGVLTCGLASATRSTLSKRSGRVCMSDQAAFGQVIAAKTCARNSEARAVQRNRMPCPRRLFSRIGSKLVCALCHRRSRTNQIDLALISCEGISIPNSNSTLRHGCIHRRGVLMKGTLARFDVECFYWHVRLEIATGVGLESRDPRQPHAWPERSPFGI
jgi:hypothetical protein